MNRINGEKKRLSLRRLGPLRDDRGREVRAGAWSAWLAVGRPGCWPRQKRWLALPGRCQGVDRALPGRCQGVGRSDVGCGGCLLGLACVLADEATLDAWAFVSEDFAAVVADEGLAGAEGCCEFLRTKAAEGCCTAGVGRGEGLCGGVGRGEGRCGGGEREGEC